MASYTEYLGLYEKDTILDRNDTFNIDTMLNENWDRLDAHAGEVGAHLENKDNPHGITLEQLGGVAQSELITLSNLVTQNTAKIATLWDALFSDITANPFQITFADLSGITLVSGVWNKAYQRLEC